MKKKILSVVLVLALGLSSVLGTVSLSDFPALQVFADDDDTSGTDTSGGDAEEINPGISISKYVTTTYKYIEETSNIDTSTYEYTLSLDVFTTGVVYQSTTSTVPADIVLVLDQSTSMMWPASQAEDNGLDDGNIGIVDGSYTYEDTDRDGINDLTWTQAETVTVTPLYGVWSLSDVDESTYESSLGIDISDGQTIDTVTIDGVTYTYGTQYTIDFKTTSEELKTLTTKDDNTIYWCELKNGWTEAYRAVFGYLYSESRQSDLIEAVVEFIANLDTAAGHRVSIVTYNSGSSVEYTLTDTANIAKDKVYDYKPIVEMILGWVTETNSSGNSNVDGVCTATGNNSLTTTTTNNVKTFSLAHSTEIAYGVENAETILKNAKSTEEYSESGRTQLAVIFTDGIPTTISNTGETDSTSTTNVNNALQAAYNMKNDDVTVFTIAMLDEVYLSDDTGSSRSNYFDSYTTSGRTTTYYLRNGNTFISLFLDLLSSNYIGASSFPVSTFPSSSNLYNNDTDYSITADYAKTVISSTDENGETTSDYAHYYYPIDTSTTTNVTDSLAAVFETVAGMIEGTATYNLDETAQVRDVMTAEFYIPINFTEATNNDGDYAYDSNMKTYYYVGTGGGYTSDVDISVYIAYCEGENIVTDSDSEELVEGDGYSTSLYDSGHYAWSDNSLIYNTQGVTPETSGFEDDISVIVRNVYIDITDDNGDYVYYYDDVCYDEDNESYYLVDSNGGYINHSGELVNTPITLYASQQVIVEGFDFNEYYVTTTDKTGGEYAAGDYGAKLVIEFEIEPDTVGVGTGDTATGATIIGGNSIETNTTASGIYIYSGETSDGDDSYTQIEYYPVPYTDVPIVVDLSVEDQTIYLGNAISVVDLVEIDGHTIQGVANAYVDITYDLCAAEEITKDKYDNLSDKEKAEIVIKETVQGEQTVTQYYQYVTDGEGNKIVEYSVTIGAGKSAVDATTGNYTLDTLITPEVDTDYIVDVTVTPTSAGTVVETSAISVAFCVYVLHPSIDVNDIWVDYATPVDLRQDNVISVVDSEDADTYNTLSTENISWESIKSYDYDIPDPNNETPPSVTYGYTARRGIEYTAAEFFEYGVREDKEFYISSMTIDSSDGYNNTTHYTYTEDEESTTFEININRYDLEISKTVDADTYDTYPQSFIFDLSYTDTEIITQQKVYAEDVNGLTMFETEDSDSVIDLYVDTTGYGEESVSTFAIYTNTDDGNGKMTVIDGMVYYDVTAVFFGDNDSSYTEGNYYIDQENYSIIYAGKTYTAKELWADEEETIPVYETVGINDYEKTMEVIVDPDMSNVETVEWTDSEGTRYYTFNVLVTDLYCGVELDITEDTSWSWRYTPGFTTTTTTQYADYVNSDGDDDNDIDTTLHYVSQNAEIEFTAAGETVSIRVYDTDYGTYVIANIVTEDSDDVAVRTVTIGPVQQDMSEFDFENINLDDYTGFDAFLSASDLTAAIDTTSVMSVDGEGNITQTTTTETTAYKIIDYDEEIAARIAYGDGDDDANDYIDSSETIGSLGNGLLGTYSESQLGYEYAYYLTEYTFDSVAEVTTSADGSSATVLVTNSGDYLDKSAATSSDEYLAWERVTELSYYDVNSMPVTINSFDSSSINYTSTLNGNTTALYISGDSAIYYYNDSGEKVYNVLIEDSELVPTTYYQMQSVDEETVEVQVFQVAESYATVSATYFDINEVDIDVYNSLTYEYWLSYSALAENVYYELADTRVSTIEEGE